MPFLLLFALAATPPAPVVAPPPPVPECHRSGSQTGCGFHCKVGLGIVKCSQTPEGFCTTIDEQVVCWDPPEMVRLHPPRRPVVAECRSKYREVACGYSCTTSPTKIACAATPYGACISKFDDVTCWDPSDGVIFLGAPNLPQAQCQATVTEMACGYDCRTAYQHVACAQTPGGKCQVDSGKVVCWDPPTPSSLGYVR